MFYYYVGGYLYFRRFLYNSSNYTVAAVPRKSNRKAVYTYFIKICSTTLRNQR